MSLLTHAMNRVRSMYIEHEDRRGRGRGGGVAQPASACVANLTDFPSYLADYVIKKRKKYYFDG